MNVDLNLERKPLFFCFIRLKPYLATFKSKTKTLRRMFF
jgi:hypothetical protein